GVPRAGEALAQACDPLGAADRHVVPRRGELAAPFPPRREGGEQLSALAVRTLAPAPVTLYGGRAGFVSPGDAGRHVEDIASANWHASAMVAARACGSALFMDMGSTTTDIVPLRHGKVAAS